MKFIEPSDNWSFYDPTTSDIESLPSEEFNVWLDDLYEAEEPA